MARHLHRCAKKLGKRCFCTVFLTFFARKMHLCTGFRIKGPKTVIFANDCRQPAAKHPAFPESKHYFLIAALIHSPPSFLVVTYVAVGMALKALKGLKALIRPQKQDPPSFFLPFAVVHPAAHSGRRASRRPAASRDCGRARNGWQSSARPLHAATFLAPGAQGGGGIF